MNKIHGEESNFGKLKKVMVPVLIILALVLSVYAGCAFAEGGLPFKDVNMLSEGDKWWTSQLDQAYQLKLLKGTGPDKYSPGVTVSYAEFITAVLRIKEGFDWKPQNGAAWYQGYINKASQEGMLKDIGGAGFVEGDFKKPIPRQDMMKILCNAFGLKQKYSPKFFIDDENVKPADAGYIIRAYAEYLTQGEGIKNGKLSFGYDHMVDRKQFAKMVMSIYEYNKDPEAYKKKMQEQLRRDNSELAKIIEEIIATLSDDPGVLPNVKDAVINLVGGVFTGDLAKVDVGSSESLMGYFLTYDGENTFKSEDGVSAIIFNDTNNGTDGRRITMRIDGGAIFLSSQICLNEEDKELLKEIYKIIFPIEYLSIYNKHLKIMTLSFGTHDEVIIYKLDKKRAQYCVGENSVMVIIDNVLK